MNIQKNNSSVHLPLSPMPLVYIIARALTCTSLMLSLRRRVFLAVRQGLERRLNRTVGAYSTTSSLLLSLKTEASVARTPHDVATLSTELTVCMGGVGGC